jgi:hypothetical protein
MRGVAPQCRSRQDCAQSSGRVGEMRKAVQVEGHVWLLFLEQRRLAMHLLRNNETLFNCSATNMQFARISRDFERIFAGKARFLDSHLRLKGLIHQLCHLDSTQLFFCSSYHSLHPSVLTFRPNSSSVISAIPPVGFLPLSCST